MPMQGVAPFTEFQQKFGFVSTCLDLNLPLCLIPQLSLVLNIMTSSLNLTRRWVEGNPQEVGGVKLGDLSCPPPHATSFCRRRCYAGLPHRSVPGRHLDHRDDAESDACPG